MNNKYHNSTDSNMSILEHLIELRYRVFISLIIFSGVTIICLIYNKALTYILQKPALGIKFLQLAPGEYLFVSVKVAVYSAIIISSPFSLSQIILFILPGLTKEESRYVIPMIIGSVILFFSGILFSYQILIPITLNFLIQYGSDIIEPIWSFEEYFNFILLIVFSTGISFQIPVLQLILGLNNIIKWQKMLRYWKYAIFIATILSAVITPSTDPITQLLMTFIILLLYFSGIIALKFIKTEKT
uniref:Sec-independent protein translocase component TatC n=1 Tax=Digenea simplex TaxID=945030 RepID=A0A1Z1MUY4_DIGSM|nr:Sec-independent protein translocase component TatC [Digenea simplex]ARW69545.1 Sec-independent protein translocase component TatC [Digenea simplex]